MTAKGKTSAKAASAGSLPRGKSAPTGFALLARRISSWTTRFVLSAMILVAGLAFGRQVLDWWAADEAEPTDNPLTLAMTDRLGDPTQPHHLEFGDARWALVRETVLGTRQQAVAALRARCRELAVSSGLPDDVPAPSEDQLLASLRGQRPVAEEPGRWSLYELKAGFPMVAGVRGGASGSEPGPEEEVAGGPPRVVTWGLAAPTGEQAWTLYAFHPAARASGLPSDLPRISLPPDGRKTLSMRVSGGGALVAFRGPSQAGGWKPFFDRRFRDRGWTAAGSWQRADSTWHLRYVRRADRRTQTVDVRFGPDGRGGTAGLVMIAPPQTDSTESERL